MKRVFLIGMPGSGKTFWGNKLAVALGYSFTDLDDYIEQQEGMSIPSIFEQYGEPVFRKKEKKALQTIIDEHKDEVAIIACGGGTPVYEDNLQLMKKNGCVIYFESDIDILFERITNDKTLRPLFRTSGDLRADLSAMLKKRESFYLQAHHIIAGKNISLPNFEKIISQCTDSH